MFATQNLQEGANLKKNSSYLGGLGDGGEWGQTRKKLGKNISF